MGLSQHKCMAWRPKTDTNRPLLPFMLYSSMDIPFYFGLWLQSRAAVVLPASIIVHLWSVNSCFQKLVHGARQNLWEATYVPYPKPFLALLCATAQQSYCHDVGVRRPSVRRPSVDIVFSETVKWIDTKFYWQVPIHHISRPFFCFSKF